MIDADRECTAYHESGHALVGMLTPGADPVCKVSIIPRGRALGVTLATPESDGYSYRRDQLGFGFRNFDNYRLRLLLRCGTPWQHRPVASIRPRQPRISP